MLLSAATAGTACGQNDTGVPESAAGASNSAGSAGNSAGGAAGGALSNVAGGGVAGGGAAGASDGGAAGTSGGGSASGAGTSGGGAVAAGASGVSGGGSGAAGASGATQTVPPLDLDKNGAYVRTMFTASSIPEPKPIGQEMPPVNEHLDSSYAFDGQLGTCWGTGTYQVGGEVFTLDMHQLVKLSKLTVDPGSGDELNCPAQEDIYVSNDGLDFGDAVVKGHVPKDHLDTIQLPSPVTARYVKFVLTKVVNGHWCAIGELNVYP